MASVPVYLLLCWVLRFYLSPVSAQTISLDTPVPPLQWINLTPLLQGPSPPPLRDAAMGYDEDSRSLVIFGGESEGGFVQSKTYLLNMNTLTWSTPSPPINPTVSPGARSGAVSGLDFAASNRHAFVVIGGKGTGGVGLSDVWAFDFTNQFWSQVTISNTGPAPRWGASGGLDTRIEPIQDQLLPGPNNTFYLAGGVDNSQSFPQSDVWRLNVSGILSANLPSNVLGSWQRIRLDETLPGVSQQGGTVLGQRIISTGGCLASIQESDGNPSCAQQNSYIIDIARRSSISPSACPPPRLDPVLAPNLNGFSSRFASQVFLTLGTVNNNVWDNNDGLEQGEVDVLDASTGSWSRILPAGDPGSSGQIAYPSPREGATVFSYIHGLVGSERDKKSDTIVFGGRDASGKYLSEVWLLRSYAGALSSTSTTWSGYGDGALRSGIDANGSGVTVRYFDRCASIKNTTEPDGGDGGVEDPLPPSPDSGAGHNASLSHKLLSTLSTGLLLLSFLLVRVFPISFYTSNLIQLRSFFILLFALCSYAIGVAGFAFAFASSFVTDPDSGSEAQQQQRQQYQSGHSLSLAHISTLHGITSVIFFVLLYGVTPALLLLTLERRRRARRRRQSLGDTTSQASESLRDCDNNIAPSLADKHDPVQRSTSHSPSPSVLYSPPLSPPLHSSTWGGHPPVAYNLGNNNVNNNSGTRRSLDAFSLDDGGDSVGTSGPGSPRRGFEVLNRPSRTRKQSESWPTTPGDHSSTNRSLGDVDWLLRRRSLNAVGELDYALSLAHNAHHASATTAEPSQLRTEPQLDSLANIQPPLLIEQGAYVFAQVGLLGLNVVTLIALWWHAPKAAFIVNLVWVLVIYVCLVFIPRRFKTEDYMFSKLRNPKIPPASKETSPPSLAPNAAESTHHSIVPPGPYLHPPPFLRTVPVEPTHMEEPRSIEGEDDDDDIDEETRQRMIEEEMDRRDVSIVTVPKRKLWVANPS